MKSCIRLETNLERHGEDAEFEFRIWQMKNIQLINNARQW
jgi:hypothetical protein